MILLAKYDKGERIVQIKVRLLVVLCIAALLLYNETVLASIKEPQTGKEESSVCEIEFVLDVSGSMAGTDAGKTAVGLIKNTISLLEKTRTRVGLIGYNHSIAYEHELIDVREEKERTALQQYLADIRFYGDTDIGLGVKRAVETLIKDDKKANKIVILISDGESILPPGKYERSLSDSQADAEEGIRLAAEEGISIYTIGLTNKFDGNVDNLQEFSMGTKGESYTANSAYELTKVIGEILKKYYYFQLVTISSEETETGETKWNIPIPDASVSRLNVLLFFLANPEELKVLSTTDKIEIKQEVFGSSFMVQEPPEETIGIRYTGTKKSKLAIAQIIYPIKEQLTISKEVGKREVITPVLQFYQEEGTLLEDASFYSNLKATFFVAKQGSSETTRYEAKAERDGLYTEICFETSGSYEIYVEFEGTYLQGKTAIQSFEVINEKPEAGKDLEITMAGRFQSKELDISELFQDKDGDHLTLSIDKREKIIQKKGKEAAEKEMDFSKEAVLTGTTFTICPQEYGTIVYQIQAVDEDGERVTAKVQIESQPIWKYYYQITITIAVVVLLLTALVIILIIRNHYRKKPVELPPVQQADPYFEGCLNGYMITLPNDEEIEPLKWELKQYHRKNFTLEELLKEKGITLELKGSDRIELRAGEGRTMELFHRSKCLIMAGSREIPPRVKVTLHFGDKVYICFEDKKSEMEVRYKSC